MVALSGRFLSFGEREELALRWLKRCLPPMLAKTYFLASNWESESRSQSASSSP
jgi:hypothetical protein